MQETDADLLARLAAGDSAAADALVLRHGPRTARLAQRMLGDAAEAEDVAQEALLRAWRQAPAWRAGEAQFQTWLHRVTLNLCYDRLRRRRETPQADAGLMLVDPAQGPDEAWFARQLAKRVHQALALLPERQRAAIALCHFEEMSNIDAAAALEVSVEALESLLSRGRRALKERLADLASTQPAGKD